MKRNLIIFAVLAVAILLVYSNSFKTEWHFDDSVNITRNKNIHMTEFNWQSIKASWFSGGQRGDIYHPILYRPVSMFSFALNYYFHGLDVLGYHIVNVLVHIIAALFLFLFIVQVLTLPKLREKYGDYAWQIAGIAALLWAVNPVQLTNITYIVQRQAALCGMFYIAGVYFYIRARKSKSLHQYILSGVAIVLAVGSKENAIMALFAIALFEVMFFGVTRKKLYVFGGLIVGGVLLVLAVQGWETFSGAKLAAGYAKRDFTLAQRLLTEPRVVVFYIMLLLFPYHGLLSLTHVVPLSHGLLNPPETLVGLLIITLFLALALLKIRKHPLIAYCIFFFFLNHIVESSFLPLELVYEHRNYVPSMLFFVPIAIVIIHLYRHWLKSVAIVGTALVLLFMGYNTYTQNKVWVDDLSLWHDVCKKSPDPRSVFNYAGSIYREHDLKRAMEFWQISYQFNHVFGTDYKEDPNIIPYGRVMYMAYNNYKKVKLLYDHAQGWENLTPANAWTIRRKPQNEIKDG